MLHSVHIVLLALKVVFRGNLHPYIAMPMIVLKENELNLLEICAKKYTYNVQCVLRAYLRSTSYD